MRRRLRKKLRRREFTEWGFELAACIAIAVPAREAPRDEWEQYTEAVLARYEDLEDVLHERGLCSGGGVGEDWSLIVSPNEKQAASDEDREALAEWLKTRPWVTSFAISGPVDVNSGSPVRRAFKSKAIEFHRERPVVGDAST